MSRTTFATAGALAAVVLAASAATAAPPDDLPRAAESARAATETPPGQRDRPRPTEEARAAGIDEPGRASMGWRMKGRAPSGPKAEQAQSSSSGDGVPGIDVSSHQGNVDWSKQYRDGKRFAYVKATEGTTYTNPYFAQQYNGSYDVGMIRGAYHFALPSNSSGAAQAEYFLRNGGGWSADGKTLPGAVDLEWNPYGPTCYGKTQAQMRSWINAFLERYKDGAGRYPVIYTNTYWWNTCVGHDTSFASKSPLWIARYGSSPGTLPTGWWYETFWQYTDDPIDQNLFNGSYARLKYFATY